MSLAKQSAGQLPTQDSTSDAIANSFAQVRTASIDLCKQLSPEDCNLQAMPETSPVKWHLAHTSWFFETFVLEPFNAGYLPVNPLYAVLFNSYYNGIGNQYPRAQRGLLSRPTLDEVYDYRATVDAAVQNLLVDTSHSERQLIDSRIELGLHHEAQHQELLLTDLKYNFFQNPLFPTYRESLDDHSIASISPEPVMPLSFIDCVGGEVDIGYAGDDFCFDNELPRHTQLVRPFRFANRLVTNGEYLEFVESGGYRDPEHWLSDGWHDVQQQKWLQPLYWGNLDGRWLEYTLNGLLPLDEAAPVSHLSYYEAQAYAAWAGKRLPTEAEWESVAQLKAPHGNFIAAGHFHPQAARGETDDILQLYGDCWEWTNSAYLPYPGYKPLPGAVGEYNGKFMSGQMVLRGGSCLSDAFHVRSSYRNFFYPRDRWQCSGLRLTEDI
jgi:ergothioneine biosynthesis protein EgtB